MPNQAAIATAVATLRALAPVLVADDPKPLLTSKIVWAAVLLPVVTYASMRLNLGLDAETLTLITSTIGAVILIVLRKMTRAPIAGVVAVPGDKADTPV